MRLALLLLLVTGTSVAATLVPPPYCTVYFGRLSRALLLERPVQWKSTQLSTGPLVRTDVAAAKARVREIVEAIYDPQSHIGKELDEHLRGELLNTKSNWIRDYYRAYELFYYSLPYLDVVRRVHDKLPPDGTILDVGSGTGGLGQLLVVAAAGRSVSHVDHELALGIPKQRLAELFPDEEGRVHFIPHYINPLTPIPTDRHYESAVLNHTLYAMLPSTKRAALNGIRARLKPGGTLVVNEPLRETAGTEAQYRAWMTHVMEQAFVNGSPHSEFDVAMVMAMASGRATKSLRGGMPLQRALMTEAEHEAMFREAGFTVESKESTYDGFSRLWVLRVP